MGLALAQYSQDYDEVLVPFAYGFPYTRLRWPSYDNPNVLANCPLHSCRWPGLLQPYIKNTQIFRCPSYAGPFVFPCPSLTAGPFCNMAIGSNYGVSRGLIRIACVWGSLVNSAALPEIPVHPAWRLLRTPTVRCSFSTRWNGLLTKTVTLMALLTLTLVLVHALIKRVGIMSLGQGGIMMA
jgi:hypothetical protein